MITPEQVGPFEIACVPAFSDNYLWLVKSGDAVAVVDPGDGEAVLSAADQLGWTISHILNTHWHPDHVGGNLRVKQATGATIYGPAPEAEKIPGIDHALDEGDCMTLGGEEAEIWHIPGHTLGHIAYLFRDADVAFVGDTVFAMGCGRMFEGTAEQMHASLQRFRDLPGSMKLYCAHEYTLANGKFAAHAFPGDPAIAERLERTEAMRARDERTVPTTVEQEIATNPFLRASDSRTFAELRSAKDRF
ncbi:hydroxyacylglutathione hydrolase [Sphingomicrobium lutaoense]|uniref:Hydroxyacylglutathione hydrolase n=1 Tax=Sphingomicrobium lutaoense TaxID=515949 RepID=A0A839Z057_9SPHN|nr:hydroxyacylglutathione hydrolase [Sphingomicrobium lutaoense]MBB3764646.1 hydroxyacylglutathione hydrolase [Sphingomicrobium lutaoense]